MVWVDFNSFKMIEDRLSSYVKDDRLTVYPFHNVEIFFRERFFKAQFGSFIILIKMQEFTGKDSMKKEYQIGLQLNELRKLIPNFLGTFAYFKGNPQTSVIPPAGALRTKYDVRFVALEFLPGDTLKPNFPLDKIFRALLQVFGALDLAYHKYGFTHYNLHRGNVMCKPCEPTIIAYDGYEVETDFIAILIDFGRSYTEEVGGTELQTHSVYEKPNILHDIFLLLMSTLKKKYPQVCRKICSFYELVYDQDISAYENLSQTLKKGKYRSPKKLAKFLESEFDFTAVSSKMRRYKPQPYEITQNPYLTPLVETKNTDIHQMATFRHKVVD